LSYDQIGYGAAVALVLFAIVLLCTVALVHARRRTA
jgi:ABC-type sugar transport system permease subunit